MLRKHPTLLAKNAWNPYSLGMTKLVHVRFSRTEWGTFMVRHWRAALIHGKGNGLPGCRAIGAPLAMTHGRSVACFGSGGALARDSDNPTVHVKFLVTRSGDVISVARNLTWTVGLSLSRARAPPLPKQATDILKNKWIKYTDRRIISPIYQDQKTVVDMQEERREASFRKEVRQGCSFPNENKRPFLWPL